MSGVPTMITFDSLAKAGAPAGSVSDIRRWANNALSGNSPSSAVALAKLHGKAVADGIVATAVGGVTGAIAGAVHGSLPGGLDYKKVPTDAAAAAVALAGSVLLAGDEAGPHLRGVAGTLTGVYAFRKVNDMVTEMQLKKSGVTPGGGAYVNTPGKMISKIAGEGKGRPKFQTGGSDIGADPLVKFASRL